MNNEKKVRIRRCKHCHEILDRIWFTATMTEEWSWTGQGYNQCTARHSLVTDREQPVLCPNCENVVGTGVDFGF